MELSITVSGVDAVAETAALRTWLREGRLADVHSIDQIEEPPGPGEQGPELLAILTIILGAQATIELVRSIHRYIEARKPKVTIVIKTPKKSIEIRTENPPPLSELTAQAKKLARG